MNYDTEFLVDLGKRWSDLAQRADRSDMAGLLADDFVMWYNFNGSQRGKQAFLATLHGARELFPDQYHTEERVTATTDGFVLQATMNGTLSGTKIAAAFCLVCRVRNGLIYRADEYFDTRQLPYIASAESNRMEVRAG